MQPPEHSKSQSTAHPNCHKLKHLLLFLLLVLYFLVVFVCPNEEFSLLCCMITRGCVSLIPMSSQSLVNDH
jgi:hypothetical protein